MQHWSMQQSKVFPQMAPLVPQQVLEPLPWLVPHVYFVWSGQHSLLFVQAACGSFGMHVHCFLHLFLHFRLASFSFFWHCFSQDLAWTSSVLSSDVAPSPARTAANPDLSKLRRAGLAAASRASLSNVESSMASSIFGAASRPPATLFPLTRRVARSRPTQLPRLHVHARRIARAAKVGCGRWSQP